MTEYTPFQEPTTTDVEVIRRRTWEELRRVETALAQSGGGTDPALEARVTQLETDVTDLQSRVFDLETIQQVLLDGVYGVGHTDDSVWAPGTATPTTAARVPIESHDVTSNVTPAPFSVTPLFAADYAIDVRLHFAPDGNNRTWNVAVFVNGVQAGNGYSFNSRDNPELVVTGLFGAHLNAGDEIDIRLWPNSASDTGTILDYTYSLNWLGLDDEIT